MTADIQLENIIIEPTNVCNAQCVFCPREQYIHKLQHMPLGLFEKIIKEVSELGLKSVAFGGFGEPLCDPTLIKKIKYVKKINGNLKIFLTSTLSLLDEKLIDSLIENVDTIHVSFYGMAQKTYENIHGGALKFEKSRENILCLVDKKKKLKSENPKIVMRYLISERNIDEMEQFITFWEPMVDEVMVWRPHNYLYGRKYRDVDISKQESCGRPFSNALNFDIEGRVTVCCFDFNKELEIGNIKHQKIKEILLGKRLEKLKSSHRTHDYSDLVCKSCDQRIKNPDVLVYSSNKNRSINTLNQGYKDCNLDKEYLKKRLSHYNIEL